MGGECAWRAPLSGIVTERGGGFGNIAYEDDRKYGAFVGGKVNGDRVSFEVPDIDRGTVRFGFHLDGEKLVGDDGAVLTKWTRRWDRPMGPPSVVSKVDPEYSEEARKEHFSGTVKLGILILTNGTVDRRSVKVLSSAGADLDEKAIEAVLQWKFTPPREDCNFYEKRLTLEVNFRLL